MKKEKLTRRDVLKLFAAAGTFSATAKLLKAAGAAPRASRNADKPNVLIVVFDSLSARNMSLYGYARQTTPNIEKFAAKSTVFHRNYSAANYTQSSVASLLTGVYPWSHRSLEYDTPLPETYLGSNLFRVVTPAYRTLAYTHNSVVANIMHQFKENVDLLKPISELALYDANGLAEAYRNDYAMGYYAAKQRYAAPTLDYSLFFSIIRKISFALRSSNLKENYRSLYPLGLCDSLDGVLFMLEDAIDWIAEIAGATAQPFLGYFHLLPPHENYTPRADFVNLFAGDGFIPPQKPAHHFSKGLSDAQLAQLRQRYDEYIAFVDSEFGRLVDLLEKNGRMDDTYVILTSDHGQLFERGIHGHVDPVLYEAGIHVPLVVHAPGQTARADVHSPTSGVDLLPAILRLTGQSSNAEYEGQALPTLGGEENSGRAVFTSFTRQNPKMQALSKCVLSAIRLPYKLIVYKGYAELQDREELYDLENDPEELNNLVQTKPQVAAELKAELEQNLQRAEKKALGR